MMIAGSSSNNHHHSRIENIATNRDSNTSTSMRMTASSIVMMMDHVVVVDHHAPPSSCSSFDEEDDDDYIVANIPPPLALNNRVGANVTSSSLPSSKTGEEDQYQNKLNLYDLLYTGMKSNSKTKNSMKSRCLVQNQPLSPKRGSSSTANNHGCIMRRSVSHDPQGLRNASWGAGSNQCKTSFRSSFPSNNNNNHQMRMMTTTTRRTMIQNKTSSSLDSATRLQRGVHEMLEMLQSTTFVGTIDPLFHGQYLKTGEEKVDEDMRHDDNLDADADIEVSLTPPTSSLQ